MQKKRTLVLLALLAMFIANCSGVGANVVTATSHDPSLAVDAKSKAPALDVASQSTAVNAPPQTPAMDVAFKSPEEAITYYLDGVTQNDISKILQACAINEMGEKFNFDLSTERLGGVMMPLSSLSPTNYPLYSEMNKAQISSQILTRVRFLSYSLLSNEKMDGSSIPNMDSDRVNRFIKDVDPKRLSNLEIKKITPLNKRIINDSRYLENAAQNARIYGADELTERVVLFSFEENYYYIGFTLLRYGEIWKISSPTSAIINTPALGTPIKTTVQGFENLINGN